MYLIIRTTWCSIFILIRLRNGMKYWIIIWHSRQSDQSRFPVVKIVHGLMNINSTWPWTFVKPKNEAQPAFFGYRIYANSYCYFILVTQSNSSNIFKIFLFFPVVNQGFPRWSSNSKGAKFCWKLHEHAMRARLKFVNIDPPSAFSNVLLPVQCRHLW